MNDTRWLGERPREMSIDATLNEARDRVIAVLRDTPSIGRVETEADDVIVAHLRTTWGIRAGRVKVTLEPVSDRVRVIANVRIPHGVVGFVQQKSDTVLTSFFERLKP